MIEKKVLLIWDLDGPIGQINSSYPYNYEFDSIKMELANVKTILAILNKYRVKSCFAITGFSAETGVYPFNFPELINEIALAGHEIASHSWKHERLPAFSSKQILKSLIRSKQILETITGKSKKVLGFVPPHNRPMSWLRRGAISLGDGGVFPFYRTSDMHSIIKLLKEANYLWVRVSYQNLLQKIGLQKRPIAGKVHYKNGMLILENHYNGFDEKIIKHILGSNEKFFIVSAHPLMFSFKDKGENEANLINFLEKLTSSNQAIKFIFPADLLVSTGSFQKDNS